MWQRSSFCEGGHCIEVAEVRSPGCVAGSPVTAVALRSTNGGDALGATPEEWRAFIAGVKAGEFDHLGMPPKGDEVTDMLDTAWTIIANAGETNGGWAAQSQVWQDAAVRWRDRWHAWMDAQKGKTDADTV